MLVFKDQKGQVWKISKVNDISGFDQLLDEAKSELGHFRPETTMPLAQQLGTARQRLDDEECKTFRMESVRHAKEGHLGPGGVTAGLAAATNLLSFEEEESDDEDDFTDESLSSKSDDNKSNSESRS